MNKVPYKHIHGFLKSLKAFSAPLMLSLGIATLIGLMSAQAAAIYYCGSKDQEVETSIDFGCKGTLCHTNPAGQSFCGASHSGVIDLLFAIIRFLSAGVGIVVIGSIVYAGIQYTTSRGDPQATAVAIKRIRNTTIALGIYIFAYAILNYLIPAGFFT